MNCPVDGSELRITDRQGIEIDYCPQCRGVWLDRGELDKILDRATPAVTLQEPAREAPRRDDHREPRREEYRGDDRPRSHDEDYHKKKKRRGLLDDSFDF